MQYFSQPIEWWEIHSNIWANDVALCKDSYIMGFKGRQRRIGLGCSVGLLMTTQLVQRNLVGSLRVGVLSLPILSFVLCPEIYNALL